MERSGTETRRQTCRNILPKNALEHHGILGQKWGVRRYQNPDGTRTAAGKLRYGKTGKEISEGIVDTFDGKKMLKRTSRFSKARKSGHTYEYDPEYRQAKDDLKHNPEIVNIANKCKKAITESARIRDTVDITDKSTYPLFIDDPFTGEKKRFDDVDDALYYSAQLETDVHNSVISYSQKLVGEMSDVKVRMDYRDSSVAGFVTDAVYDAVWQRDYKNV